MHKSTPKPDRSTKPGRNRQPSPSNPQDLALRNLGRSIIESLCPGVVAFDDRLKVLYANTRAEKLIDLGEYIDRSLAKGSDANVWGNWTELLNTVISTGSKAEFDAVRYTLGDQKKLLHIVCTPLECTKARKTLGGVVLIDDTTGKVNTERELAQAERLAAVGKVAGKVAHELNNPMDGILRYINLAIRLIEKENLPKPKEYLLQCRSGLMRMIQIISELLEFSRTTYSAFDYAPIDQIIADAVKAMEPKLSNVDIQIVHHCTGPMPHLRSPSLFQVFTNLIKNAADAMQGRGRLAITIQCSDETISVQFRDTGPGFPPESAEDIFKPFFTTKTRGKGTGLGLAICKDIVEKYEGKITAQNAPDHGSIFTVHLPATAALPPQPQEG